MHRCSIFGVRVSAIVRMVFIHTLAGLWSADLSYEYYSYVGPIITVVDSGTYLLSWASHKTYQVESLGFLKANLVNHCELGHKNWKHLNPGTPLLVQTKNQCEKNYLVDFFFPTRSRRESAKTQNHQLFYTISLIRMHNKCDLRSGCHLVETAVLKKRTSLNRCTFRCPIRHPSRDITNLDSI